MEADKSSTVKAEISPSGGLKMRIRLEKSQTDVATVQPSNEWVTETRGGGIGKLVFKRKHGNVTPSPEAMRIPVVIKPSPGPCNILRLSFVPGANEGTFTAQIKNCNSYDPVSATVEDTASGMEMSPACHLQPSPKDSGIDISSPPRDDGHLASVLLGSDSHDDIRLMPPSERALNNCMETDCIQTAEMLNCEQFVDRNDFFDVSHCSSKLDSSKVQSTLRTKAERTADSVQHSGSFIGTIGKSIIISRKFCGKKTDFDGTASWTVSTSGSSILKKKRKRPASDECATYNLTAASDKESKTEPVKPVERVVLRLKQREVGSDMNINDNGSQSNPKKVKIEGNAGTKLRFKCYTRESSQMCKQQYFVEVAGAANIATDRPQLGLAVESTKRSSKSNSNQSSTKSVDISSVTSNLLCKQQLTAHSAVSVKQAARKTNKKIKQSFRDQSSSASAVQVIVDHPVQSLACDVHCKDASENNTTANSSFSGIVHKVSCSAGVSPSANVSLEESGHVLAIHTKEATCNLKEQLTSRSAVPVKQAVRKTNKKLKQKVSVESSSASAAQMIVDHPVQSLAYDVQCKEASDNNDTAYSGFSGIVLTPVDEASCSAGISQTEISKSEIVSVEESGPVVAINTKEATRNLKKQLTRRSAVPAKQAIRKTIKIMKQSFSDENSSASAVHMIVDHPEQTLACGVQFNEASDNNYTENSGLNDVFFTSVDKVTCGTGVSSSENVSAEESNHVADINTKEITGDLKEQLTSHSVVLVKQTVRKITKKIKQHFSDENSGASAVHTIVDHPVQSLACDIQFKEVSENSGTANSDFSGVVFTSVNEASCSTGVSAAVEESGHIVDINTDEPTGNLKPGLSQYELSQTAVFNEPAYSVEPVQNEEFENILTVSRNVFHPSPLHMNVVVDTQTRALHLQHCDPGGPSIIDGVDEQPKTRFETTNLLVLDEALNVNTESATMISGNVQLFELNKNSPLNNSNTANEDLQVADCSNASFNPVVSTVSDTNVLSMPHFSDESEGLHHIQCNSPSYEVSDNTSLNVNLNDDSYKNVCNEQNSSEHVGESVVVPIDVALSVDTRDQHDICRLSNSDIIINSQFNSMLSVENSVHSGIAEHCDSLLPFSQSQIVPQKESPSAILEAKKGSYMTEFAKFISTTSMDSNCSTKTDANTPTPLKNNNMQLLHEQETVKCVMKPKTGNRIKKIKVRSETSDQRPMISASKRHAVLREDEYHTRASSNCVYCVRNKVTSSNVINVDRCMSGHRRLVTLRNKVCDLIDAVFPRVEYPKGFQRNSLSVERFIDQLLQVLHSPYLNSDSHSLNCSEPFVEICCSLDRCANELRMKILRLISALLPNVELPEFNDDETLEVFLEVLTSANCTESKTVRLSTEEFVDMNPLASLPSSLMSSLPGACISLGVPTLSEVSPHCSEAMVSASLNSVITPHLFGSQVLTNSSPLVDKKSIKRQVKDCLMFLDLDLT